MNESKYLFRQKGLIKLERQIEEFMQLLPAKLSTSCHQIDMNEKLITIGTGQSHLNYDDSITVLRHAFLTKTTDQMCAHKSKYPGDIKSIICGSIDMDQYAYSGDSGETKTNHEKKIFS